MLEVISIICCIIIVCIIIVLVESKIECAKYKIKKYSLTSSKINEDIKIVMLADLHNSNHKDNHKRMLEDIKAVKPDVIILAGDMIVSHSDQDEENKATAKFINKLSDIAPLYYGIGNHEKKATLSKQRLNELWQDYMSDMDFSKVHLLVNEKAQIAVKNNKINILGLDLDIEYYKRFVEKKLSQAQLIDIFGDIDNENYNILIAHNPDYFKVYADYGVDLVCSGHNHGGLVRLPLLGGVISPRLRLFPKYDYGIFLSENTHMVLTSGLGAHSIKIRFNNVPELVFIEIKEEK